mgnify:CR=1 FL=1
MAIYRTHKKNDYTLINNYLIKDKNLSLKDKGMLLVLLSLPDDWDFSVMGLMNICRESKNTINDILNNLQKYEYLERNKIYENGKIKDWQYDIYEIPKNLYLKNQDIEIQDIDFLDIENYTQLNTNILNTKKLNTKKYIYGEFKNVLLTDEEYHKLEQANLLPYIEKLSSYIASKGKKYKSHYATILTWNRGDKKDTRKHSIEPEWLDKDIEEEVNKDAEEFARKVRGED